MLSRIVNNLEPFELVGLAIMFALVVDAVEGWI